MNTLYLETNSWEKIIILMLFALKAYKLPELIFFVYIKSCQY